MHRSPSKFVLLLMAAAVCSFFLVAHARQLQPVHPASASCLPRERDALLAFKRGITNDTYGFLASWQQGGQDCCRWTGVTCSNVTGHVIQLELSYEDLVGQISPSLLSLEHLEYLDLSYTSLTRPNGRVPEFLGYLKNLRHLDLSGMPFSGRVPPQLGNLSKLEYLSLSCYQYLDHSNTMHNMYSTDISWLTRLPLLYLDMSYVNLSTVAEWPLVLNIIPSLEELCLQRCSLPSANQSLRHLNLTNLQSLELSGNYFDHPIAASWFWNVSSIKHLGLSETYLYGPFPSALGRMTSLQVLYFSDNGNKSTMMVDLKNLCDLEVLYLGGSLSSGNITEFIENLPECPSNKLQFLGLSHNTLVGKLPNMMGHLTSLTHLDLSNNYFIGALPPGLGNCTSLEDLDISNNHLIGAIPPGLGKCTSLEDLDLSNNHLIGAIPPGLGNCTSLEDLDLSNNHLIGAIPPGLRNYTSLEDLDLNLSNNHLIGAIPPGLANCTSLGRLELSNNHLTGTIPPKIGNCASLVHLAFSNNHLIGAIPPGLGNCASLGRLDLSNNHLTGAIPPEIGNYTRLEYLAFSNNHLTGQVPSKIGVLGNLKVLDLSYNNLV